MKYRIIKRGNRATLYVRFWKYFWLPVDRRIFIYEEHAIRIAIKWMEEYGRENFVRARQSADRGLNNPSPKDSNT